MQPNKNRCKAFVGCLDQQAIGLPEVGLATSAVLLQGPQVNWCQHDVFSNGLQAAAGSKPMFLVWLQWGRHAFEKAYTTPDVQQTCKVLQSATAPQKSHVWNKAIP